MIISVVSIVEVKPLILMLARGLSTESKVLIVTNDITYRRIGVAVSGNEYIRRIDNIDIKIDFELEDTAMGTSDIEAIASGVSEETFEKYECIIVASSDKFVGGEAVRIYCEGTDTKWRTSMVTGVINSYKDDDEIVDNETNKNSVNKVIELIVTSNANDVKDKTKCVVSMDASTVMQMMNIEYKHSMEIFSNKSLMNSICKVIAPVLGIKEHKMYKMIKKKVTITSDTDIPEN